MSKEDEVIKHQTKIGRCTKYIPEYNEVAGNLSLAGFSDKEVAKVLGIAEQTLYNWQDAYPAFKKAMADGKEVAVGIVTRSLYQRSLGYEAIEIKTEKDDCGNVYKVTENKKHIPPDTGAMSLFLKSKAPDKFSEKRKLEIEGTINPLSVKLEKFHAEYDNMDASEASQAYREIMG